MACAGIESCTSQFYFHTWFKVCFLRFFLAVFSDSTYMYTPVIGRKRLLHLIDTALSSYSELKASASDSYRDFVTLNVDITEQFNNLVEKAVNFLEE